MALPSKKSKLNINLDPPKAGNEYLKYGMDRIEELMINTDKKTTYLPKNIDFKDIDQELFNFVKDGKIELILDDKKIPVFYLENERWGEFSKTWTMMDGDKNVPTPYLTIRRIDRQEGTRLGKKWAIPQGKAHRYLDVPIMDDGQVIYLRFKIPEPTNVDLVYDLKLFTKYRIDVNEYDTLIMNAFKSRQEYIWVKGNPMPVILDSLSEANTVESIDGDKYYASTFNLRVLGFIQDEEEFEIVRTSRQPKFGIDLTKDSGGGRTVPRTVATAADNIEFNLSITNTDDSYSVITNNDLILPDITITNLTGGTVIYPSVKDLNLFDIPVGSYPITATTYTYRDPILSQTTVYHPRDEAWQLTNVWLDDYTDDSRNALPAVGLDDFYTLSVPNKFGNFSRFTDYTGGTLNGGVLTINPNQPFIDHYLGLELVGTGISDILWENALDYTQTFDDGSWYMPPRALVQQLIDNEVTNSDSFVNRDIQVGSNRTWTSTTRPNDPTRAWSYDSDTLAYAGRVKATDGSVELFLVYRPLDRIYNITGGTTGNVTTFTYNFPVLSQETIVGIGDEGWQLANIWQPIYNNSELADLPKPLLIDFYTLASPNRFGNYGRFTTTGGTIATNINFENDEIIYDNYLGIQILRYQIFNNPDGWDGMISDARSFDDGTWNLPPLTVYDRLKDRKNYYNSAFNDVISENGDAPWSATNGEANPLAAYTYVNGSHSTSLKDVTTRGSQFVIKPIDELTYTSTGATIPLTEFTYNFPTLTQRTSYRDGDEGWQLANVWNIIYGDVELFDLPKPQLLDFYTLSTPNYFGNYERFTNPTGGTIADGGDDFINDGDIIYDHYLGLQYINTNVGLGNWTDFIDGTRTYDDGSWYPLPIILWNLLWDASKDNSGNGTPNNKIPNVSFVWSSTSRISSPVDNAYTANFTTTIASSTIKTATTPNGAIGYKPLDNLTYNATGGTGVTNTSESIYYNYPLETQSVSYRDGDAGWVYLNEYQQLYSGRLGDYNTPRLEDYFTLTNNNVFGNRSRFTDITGGTISNFQLGGSDFFGTQRYFIDHFTGLGWSPDLVNGNQDTDWNTAIDFARAYTGESFTDYHLPSVAEFATLEKWDHDFDGGGTANFWKLKIFGFSGNENTSFWTSSTSGLDNIVDAYDKSNQTNNNIELQDSGNADKTLTNKKYFGVCRIHFKADSQTQPDIETIDIRNTSGSYTAETATNIVLPDITVTGITGNTQTVPSVVNIDVSNYVTVEYAYPILNESIGSGSIRDGDETWQVVNVWQSVYDSIPDNAVSLRLTDFYTLNRDNMFGNRNRFTLSGGTLPPNLRIGEAVNNFDVEIYDHYLGIIFLATAGTGGTSTWNQSIDDARAYGDGGWYLAPYPIVWALCESANSSNQNINLYTFVNGTSWISTYRRNNTLRAYRFSLASSSVQFVDDDITDLNAGGGIYYRLI